MAGSSIYCESLRDDRFRLLRLDLSDMGDDDVETKPLCLRMTTHSLADRPCYTCASYAWREPLAVRKQGDNTVSVNGAQFTVQANLAHGLRVHLAHLRQHGVAPGSEPHIWIDAVCINQRDIPERGAQVAIMHHIYRGARDVLVWLGPDPDGEAYRVREFFRAVLKQYWICEGQPNYTGQFVQRRTTDCLPSFGLPALEDEIWKTTVQFWDRAWFTRVWVQQEVAMAQKATFWCGDIEFTQLELEHFSRFLANSGVGGFLLLVRRGYVGDGAFAGAAVGVGAARFSGMQGLMRGQSRAEDRIDTRYGDLWTGPANDIQRGIVQRSLVRTFAGLLYISFIYEASDKRDKIFAQLVLMHEISVLYELEKMPLVADYTRSSVEVYRDVTAWIIGASGWLGILNWISPKRSVPSQHSQMPSWVVDFGFGTASTGMSILQDQPTDALEKANRYLTPETRPTVRDMVLSISVQRIGTIVEYGENWDDMIYDGRIELVAALLLNCPPSVNDTGRTRLDAWISAWMGNSSASPQSASIRARFGRWARSRLRLRLSKTKNVGSMLDAFEALKSQLQDLLQLAEEDESGVLPTQQELEDRIAGRHQEADEGSRANFAFDSGVHCLEHWGRRLLRLASLGSPYCPSAMLLGIGPQTCQVGDEVCFVAGSMMPLVLRPLKTSSSNSVDCLSRQAHFVGLASVADAIEPLPGQWQSLHVV